MLRLRLAKRKRHQRPDRNGSLCKITKALRRLLLFCEWLLSRHVHAEFAYRCGQRHAGKYDFRAERRIHQRVIADIARQIASVLRIDRARDGEELVGVQAHAKSLWPRP